MNVINNYIEAMFLNMTMSDELICLKEDILGNMEDKFNELIFEGVSESEAIGVVISEFGSIEELIEEFSLERERPSSIKSLPLIEKASIIDYLATRRKGGLHIGIGVMLCGFGAALAFIAESIGNLFIVLPFLLVSAIVGVSLFIKSGMNLSQYQYLNKGFFIPVSSQNELVKQRNGYRSSLTVGIIVGVSLCMLAVTALIYTAFANNIIFGLFLFFILGSAGSFFFIYCGNVYASYGFLINNGLSDELSDSQVQQELRVRRIDEIVWPLVVVVYLVVSFMFGAWAISWIIFPIVAIISSFWTKR